MARAEQKPTTVHVPALFERLLGNGIREFGQHRQNAARSQSGRARAVGAAKELLREAGRAPQRHRRASITQSHMPAVTANSSRSPRGRRREPVPGNIRDEDRGEKCQAYLGSSLDLHAEYDGFRTPSTIAPATTLRRTAAAFGAELAVYIALAENEGAGAEHGP